MRNKNKEILNAKIKELQVKLAVSDFYSNYMKDWMKLYISWRQIPIHLELVYLSIVESEYKKSLIKVIEQEGVFSSQHVYDLIWNDFEKDILKKIQQNFPSKNLLSYVPDLQAIGNCYHNPLLLSKYFEERELAHTIVYLIYSRYAPVIRLPLHEFLMNYKVFKQDDYYDDMLLFPADYSWLLFGSSDDCWNFGFK